MSIIIEGHNQLQETLQIIPTNKTRQTPSLPNQNIHYDINNNQTLLNPNKPLLAPIPTAILQTVTQTIPQLHTSQNLISLPFTSIQYPTNPTTFMGDLLYPMIILTHPTKIQYMVNQPTILGQAIGASNA